MPVPAEGMDLANGAVGSSTDSLVAEVDVAASPVSSPVIKTKGRGLRRWRRITREQHKEGCASAAADEDSAQLHKRRMPLAADAPKGKHEVVLEEESSAASVESRFVPLASVPVKLDPNLGTLIASSGFSVGAGGADSDNSDVRSSKSSTAASAPRHHDFSPLARERTDRGRSRVPGFSLHGKNPRAARARTDKTRSYSPFSPADAENSRSSVESDLRSSNAVNSQQSGVNVTGNVIYKVLSDDCDHSDEGQPSEEVRSTAGCYYKENGSVLGRFAQGSVDSDADERSVGNCDNGSAMHSSADPYAESVLLLQRTQEALENELQKFVAMSKESDDDFDACEDDRSDSVYLEEPFEEASESTMDLESRLEETAVLVKEKDSVIAEPRVLFPAISGKSVMEATNFPLPQPGLDQLFQEKIEAEIKCVILTRASQTWALLAEDQITLYNARKSMSGDYKNLELKLQHNKKRAVILQEMAEKLEAECKHLTETSEILQMQSRASRVSLFCFIQFILVLTAIGTFVARLLPSSTEDVPT
ncbi:hypothetical protein GUJ93_ZPchr0008g12775 [Zizania palustris]|uniref:Uncharacterized protein n=1 Tax=Zizania palustris TaxID=103762 RepID=A0A8J5UX35_ZIZPA|nr:hypothetical protein GUJ93_ZPchr0008g12775 [Zizania palustris]